MVCFILQKTLPDLELCVNRSIGQRDKLIATFVGTMYRTDLRLMIGGKVENKSICKKGEDVLCRKKRGSPQKRSRYSK